MEENISDNRSSIPVFDLGSATADSDPKKMAMSNHRQRIKIILEDFIVSERSSLGNEIGSFKGASNNSRFYVLATRLPFILKGKLMAAGNF